MSWPESSKAGEPNWNGGHASYRITVRFHLVRRHSRSRGECEALGVDEKILGLVWVARVENGVGGENDGRICELEYGERYKIPASVIHLMM